MNERLLEIATGLNPSPDSVLARAIEHVKQTRLACAPFATLLERRQAELTEAEHTIASAEWSSDSAPIEAALSRKLALGIVIPKIMAQIEGASIRVQYAEATVSQIVQRARGVAQYIAELTNDNIEIRGLSPARRKGELVQQRAELHKLIGRDSLPEQADDTAQRHADLQSQMAQIERDCRAAMTA